MISFLALLQKGAIWKKDDRSLTDSLVMLLI